MLFDSFYMNLVLSHIFIGDFQCLRYSNNSDYILSATTHIPFLGTTVNQRMDFLIFFHIQKPRTFWSMEFMTASYDRIDWKRLHVMDIMTHCLHRIRVKKCAI